MPPSIEDAPIPSMASPIVDKGLEMVAETSAPPGDSSWPPMATFRKWKHLAISKIKLRNVVPIDSDELDHSNEPTLDIPSAAVKQEVNSDAIVDD